ASGARLPGHHRRGAGSHRRPTARRVQPPRLGRARRGGAPVPRPGGHRGRADDVARLRREPADRLEPHRRGPRPQSPGGVRSHGPRRAAEPSGRRRALSTADAFNGNRPMNRTLVSLGTALVLMIGLACGAAAQSTLSQILDLNRQAMEAYQMLELEQAQQQLERALQLAQQRGVTGAPLARTYLNLGVVAVGGFGDNGRGMQYFRQALGVDPNISLDPLTSTPEIQTVFNLARQQGGIGGGGGGGGGSGGGGGAGETTGGGGAAP